MPLPSLRFALHLLSQTSSPRPIFQKKDAVRKLQRAFDTCALG